ncbi:MAG: hypothetical protein ACNS61_02815 [Candidatus Wenzhouxiangella sp. M2_3B_020]
MIDIEGRHRKMAAIQAVPVQIALVRVLGLSDDSDRYRENSIPYSTADYLELVDWSGRAIVEGKKGAIPKHLPTILERLSMRPEQYLAYIRKPRIGFANALGALEKLKAYADYFDKAFLKGQNAAAALFSPGQ